MQTQVIESARPATETEQAAEAALVRGLVADDPSAWRKFNRDYSRVIYHSVARIAARFARVMGGDDCREVYSMFCLQLLQNDKHKLRSFDPARGRLASWLGMLATHCAYDFLRGRKREPKGEADSVSESFASSEPDPYTCCAARERAQRVSSLMADLSERDQEFVLLYFGQGLEPELVAERMGISIKTVYSKKHKLRARLESMLSSLEVAA